MTTATATIYAWALKPADTIDGRTIRSVTSRDETVVTWADGSTTTYDPHTGVVVAADTDPDTPGVWVPVSGFWPSGCTCPMRRHPILAGNWDRAPTPAPCWACNRDDEF